MNEVRIAERVANGMIASRRGYEAWKALERAWNDLATAKQRLQMVLREDTPEDPQEIEQIVRDLEQIEWQVSGFKRQTHRLT